jgi:prophage tail gpP-like protein
MVEAAIPASDAVELKLGGRRFGGWTSIDIQLDLDQGAASFSLGVTRRDPEQDAYWELEADAACEVLVGGETLLTGYTDRLGGRLAGESHGITVSGRSKTADLIDCSAVASPGSWRGQSIATIAAELAKPFGIKVTVEGKAGAALRRFAIQQGETVWEAITRMAQHRALLPIARSDGSVALTNAAPKGAPVKLIQGRNCLSIDGTHDVADRFSQYLLKGQSAGDDEVHGKAAASPKAEAKDPAVRRYRPLIVVAEDQVDAATLKQRAQWEATVRAAKAQQAIVELTGWRREDGALWALEDAVDLEAPAAWIDDKLMVAGLRLVLDEGGRRAELRLVRPESYSQLAVPEEAESSKIKKTSRKSKREQEKDARKGKPE